MLRAKREVDAYTDGVMSVVRELPRRFDRGVDFSAPDELEEVYPLAFRSLRLRSRDADLAGAAGAELQRKVMCPLSPALAADAIVVIDGVVHDVWRVEADGRRHVAWLSEIACDGTCELVSSETYLDDDRVERERLTRAEVYVRKVSPSARRHTGDGIDSLQPGVTLRLRTVDYTGEASLVRGGVAYSIASVSGAGPWVDLTCVRREADRGRQRS